MITRRRSASPKPLCLRSRSARVELELQPGAGMVATSLRIDGEERLWLPEAKASFLRRERTGGIPLLFPWANRWRGNRAEVLGRRIDLGRATLVHRDAAGRPMHGLLLRWGRWDSIELSPDGSMASAGLEWASHAALARLFPFRFRLRLGWRVFDGTAPGVEITTELHAIDGPVPVSFGWHPYLRLPGARRRCSIGTGTPALRRVALSDGVPIRRHGALLLSPAGLGGSLARASFDDLLAGAGDGGVVAVDSDDGRRVSFQIVRGYRWVQLFSPRAAEFICVEPMTAPTAALSDSAPELPIVGPGQSWSACFRVTVEGATRPRRGSRR